MKLGDRIKDNSSYIQGRELVIVVLDPTFAYCRNAEKGSTRKTRIARTSIFEDKKLRKSGYSLL